MEIYNYPNLESKSMREGMEHDGRITVMLPVKKYEIFYRHVKALNKALRNKSELSRLSKHIAFLSGMLSLLRIVIFHIRVLSLIAFYYLANPNLSVEKSQDDKNTVNIIFSR